MQVSDHYVYFASAEVIDELSMTVPRIRNWYCLDAFSGKLREKERIGSFEVSNSGQQLSPLIRGERDP